MLDLISSNNIHQIFIFTVPGLIAIFFRSQFLTGRNPKHSEAILSYFAVSLVYYGTVISFITMFSGLADTIWNSIIGRLVVFFIIPSVLGILLGLNAQKGWVRNILKIIKINAVHAQPTSWDWKFSSRKDYWILVTLKDSNQCGGYFGDKSFVSSEPDERDLYIEKVYSLDDNGDWLDVGPKAVWIVPSEIKTIEFWPIEEEI